MNLNRTEELDIKKDIKGIKKALDTIASGIVPVKPTTQVVVKDGDPFFGKIHMSKEHVAAWEGEFDTTCLALVSLMEECAELQQAASKYYRHYRTSTHASCVSEKEAMIEEMAHVLIDIRMICHDLDISPDAIQQEIYKKYPDGYNATIHFADNAPYYVERVKGSE
jgi:NTP pyrophosphatase (non-canonical NTP hydrolase)